MPREHRIPREKYPNSGDVVSFSDYYPGSSVEESFGNRLRRIEEKLDAVSRQVHGLANGKGDMSTDFGPRPIMLRPAQYSPGVENVAGRVLQALDRGRCKWRTIPGLSQELGLPPDIVKSAIEQNGRVLVRSSRSSPEGHDLFTTRERYRATTSFCRRLLAAIKNRGD